MEMEQSTMLNSLLLPCIGTNSKEESIYIKHFSILTGITAGEWVLDFPFFFGPFYSCFPVWWMFHELVRRRSYNSGVG